MGIGKKQKASSKYKKNDLSPEEINASANPEEETKKNQAASEGKPNWWEQKGPSDEIVEKYTGKENPTHEEVVAKAKEIAERGLTPEQQGIQAKGNAGDNKLENPDAPDTYDITKNNGSANKTLTDSVSEAVTPKKEEKKKYNKSMMSIWDAHRNKLIDKDTAGYFTIDALANAAKNMGRSFGNVGAQFTGGSIDNGHDESMWDQRKDAIFNQELQGEKESIDNYENTLKRYNLTKASTVNDLLSTVKKDIDKLGDDNPLKVAYMALAAQMANGQLDGTTTLAATGGKAITSLLDLLQGKGKK